MKRGAWIFIIVILATSVYAATQTGSEVEGGPDNFLPPEDLIKEVRGSDEALPRTVEFDGATVHAGTFVNDDGSYNGRVSNDDGSFEGTNLVFDNGDFVSASFIQELQLGSVRLTGGTNVFMDEGSVCGLGADTLTEPNRVAVNVEGFCVGSVELNVDSAESVRLKCPNRQFFLAQGVTDTTFMVDGGIHAESGVGVSWDLRDCNGVTAEFESVCEGNQLDYDGKDYSLSCAALNITKNGVIESIYTNGTSEVSIVGREVQCVTLNPFSSYEYHKDGISDFAFKAWRQPHAVCFRKFSDKDVPPCVNDCTYYDMLFQNISINGAIDYQRYFFTPEGQHGPFASVFESFGGSVVLQLNPYGTIIENLRITKDKPPYYTAFSSVVQVHERSTEAGTHRFLEVNELADASRPQVLKYGTIYSSVDSVMDEGGAFIHDFLRVLPPGHEGINDLLDRVLSIKAVYLLVLLIPFGLRKGQLSIFIVIGMVIVVFLGLLVLAWNLPSLSVSKQPVSAQDLVSDCLKDVGEDAVRVVSRQGGYVTLPSRSVFGSSLLLSEGQGRVPSRQDVEKDLASYVEDKLSLCLNDFRALRGVEVSRQGVPDVRTMLTPDAVTFSLDFPIDVRKGDSNTMIREFAAIVKTDLARALDQARISVQSQLDTGYIDLDTLPMVPVTLFPYEETLLAVAEPEPFFVYGQK